jgi:hypothetical protein
MVTQTSVDFPGGGNMSLVQEELDAGSNQELYDSFDAAHVTPGIAEIKKIITDGVAGNTVILWHRAVQFKQISLKMVVSRVLQQQHQIHNQLVIPGELKLKDIQIPAPLNRQQYHICLSSHQAESDTLRSQIVKVVMAAPSRTQSRSERVLQSIGRKTAKQGNVGVSPQQLRVGVLGEGGCTMQSSSNFLLFLSTRNLLNKELMDDVRDALILGLNIIAIHNKGSSFQIIDFIYSSVKQTNYQNKTYSLIKMILSAADPNGETEEFDSFIGVCPADLREGKIVRNGEAVECPRLFDNIAVDWMGGDTTEYKEVSVALAIRAVKPAGKMVAGATEEAAKKPSIKTSDLGGALTKGGGPNATKQAVSVIEIGDI